MELVTNCGRMAHALEAQRRGGKSVGLTPTMGALHRGHVALIERMAAECEIGVVSIFVNPIQFGPHEDLDKYPRMFDNDLQLCEAAGAAFVFAPTVQEMYPAGFQTTVSIGALTKRWCGAARPGHFDGVATVVAKLFAICRPHTAYFGEKDYQQLQVVKRMAADLNLGVDVVACPTVREDDGLALSSRNAYLTPDERKAAPLLHLALSRMNEAFSTGVADAQKLTGAAGEVLAGAAPAFELEYLAVVDPLTLEPRTTARSGDRILVAARLGSTRLIDNLALTGPIVTAAPEASESTIGHAR